nr:basic leucine zipper 61-like [Ipomoea batatas]
MGSSSFSLFIVLISLTLASTATATYRVELSNETPGVQFDLHCELGGMDVGPATLAPSATATWNVEIFGGSYQDSDCTIRTDNESYHGYFLIFNENTYGVCVNGFSMCKNPDCDMVAVCIFLRQCVHLAWVVIAFVKLGVRKILRLVCGCVGDVGLVGMMVSVNLPLVKTLKLTDVNGNFVDIQAFNDIFTPWRNFHRRSVSDPIAFVEAPFMDECRGGALMACNNVINGNSIANHAFDRLDDEQLMSMFPDESVV